MLNQPKILKQNNYKNLFQIHEILYDISSLDENLIRRAKTEGLSVKRAMCMIIRNMAVYGTSVILNHICLLFKENGIVITRKRIRTAFKRYRERDELTIEDLHYAYKLAEV